MIYTDENMELRAIISDLNQQAIGYVERISLLESLVKQLEQSLDAEIGKVDALEKVAEAIEVEYAKFGHIDANVMDAMNAAGYLGEGE